MESLSIHQLVGRTGKVDTGRLGADLSWERNHDAEGPSSSPYIAESHAVALRLARSGGKIKGRDRVGVVHLTGQAMSRVGFSIAYVLGVGAATRNSSLVCVTAPRHYRSAAKASSAAKAASGCSKWGR